MHNFGGMGEITHIAPPEGKTHPVPKVISRRLTQGRGRGHLHVRTCVPVFRISGWSGGIALKFGLRLATH